MDLGDPNIDLSVPAADWRVAVFLVVAAMVGWAGVFGAIYATLAVLELKRLTNIPADRPVTVGRSAACDLCLLHEGVSRRHATVLLLSDTFHSLDAMSAFQQSVHATVNRMELTKPRKAGNASD